MDRGLGPGDRETRLRRELGARRGRRGTTFKRAGLQANDRSCRHVIGLAPGQLARFLGMEERTELIANRASADLRCPNAPSWILHLPVAATAGLVTVGAGLGEAGLAEAALGAGGAGSAFLLAAIDWARATPLLRCSSGMTASMSASVAWAGASPWAAARLT